MQRGKKPQWSEEGYAGLREQLPVAHFDPGFELKSEGGSVKIDIIGSRSHRHVVITFHYADIAN